MNNQGLVTNAKDKLHSGEITTVLHYHVTMMFTESWTNNMFDLTMPGNIHFALHRQRTNRSAKRYSGSLVVILNVI